MALEHYVCSTLCKTRSLTCYLQKWFQNTQTGATSTSTWPKGQLRPLRHPPTAGFQPLSLQGSAVAVERVFSGGCDMVSLWRTTSLKPETIRTLMLMKARLCLGHLVMFRPGLEQPRLRKIRA